MDKYTKDFIANPKSVLEKKAVIDKYKQVYFKFKDLFPGQAKDLSIAWMSGHLATLENLNVITEEKSGILFNTVLHTEVE